jgi:hypothetical protein
MRNNFFHAFLVTSKDFEIFDYFSRKFLVPLVAYTYSTLHE